MMSSFLVYRKLDVCNISSFCLERIRPSGFCKYMHPWWMGHMGWTNLNGTSFLEGYTFDTTVAAISIGTMVIVNTFVRMNGYPPKIKRVNTLVLF